MAQVENFWILLEMVREVRNRNPIGSWEAMKNELIKDTFLRVLGNVSLISWKGDLVKTQYSKYGDVNTLFFSIP